MKICSREHNRNRSAEFKKFNHEPFKAQFPEVQLSVITWYHVFLSVKQQMEQIRHPLNRPWENTIPFLSFKLGGGQGYVDPTKTLSRVEWFEKNFPMLPTKMADDIIKPNASREKDLDFIPALNLAKSIRASRPPTREGINPQDVHYFPSVNTPIFGSIHDQEPLMYEEPHPLTEPEAIKIVVIQCEKKYFHQRKKYMRMTMEDTMNFIPWDKSSDMIYETISYNKELFYFKSEVVFKIKKDQDSFTRHFC